MVEFCNHFKRRGKSEGQENSSVRDVLKIFIEEVFFIEVWYVFRLCISYWNQTSYDMSININASKIMRNQGEF